MAPIRPLRLLSVAAACAALAGCGAAGPVTTGTIADGTRVEPEQYLADAAAATDALSDFAEVVAALPRPVTAAALRAAAPRMEEPLERARAVGIRLRAERLEDGRVERQREATATAFAAAVDGMERVRNAARAGDPQSAVSATTALQRSVDALREVGANP